MVGPIFYSGVHGAFAVHNRLTNNDLRRKKLIKRYRFNLALKLKQTKNVLNKNQMKKKIK